MNEVWVELGEQRYPIYIGPGLMAELGALVRRHLPKARRALLVTDANVGPLYGEAARASLEQAGITTSRVTVPAGESSKSLSQAFSLYSSCVRAELDRTSAIVALGGGVVGDLAGFVAATYLRGIPLVQVPTTLLAQVDSSVGGKTGVDLPQGKNLVGAFHQPSLVVADVETLRSLPRRELAAGMAEVVKYGVIRDEEFLKYVEVQVGNALAGDLAVLERVVAQSCRIKAEVVAADPREKGLRAILNFGHTVGHALEAALGYRWLHGECIAVGMVAAATIARHAGIAQESGLELRLKRVLERLDLPTALPEGMDPQELEPFLRRDKKVKSGIIHWVMPVRAGEVIVTPDVTPDAIRWGLEALRR